MKYETRLMWVLGATFGFLFFDRNAASNLTPFIADDLHLNNTQIGLIASALSFSWAVSSYLGGLFSDRTGSRKAVLLVTVVAFSLCSFLSGVAGSFATLFAARFLMGAAEGPFLPVAQSLVASESTAARRGFNMGVMQNCGSNLLGSCLAPLVLIPIAQAFSWRWSFFIAGIPGLIMALLIAKYVREPTTNAVPEHAPEADRAPAAGKPSMSFRAMLGHRNMWLCMLMSIFMVAWMVLGWVFLPVYYTKVRMVTTTEYKWLMAILGLSAAFFSFVVPALSDRFGRRPIIVLFNLIGLGVPLAAMFFQGSLWWLGTLVFLTWSASGTFPLFMGTVPSETIPMRYVATSLGMVVGLGEILGGVGAPFLAGRAADLYGLQAPMIIMALCAVAGTLLALFLRETAPIRLQRSAALAAAGTG